MADQLSNDLMVEIISKLPLRNLFRCKCLNKFFYESISKPSFIKKVQKNNHVYLVKHTFLSSIRNDIFSIDLNCATAPHIPKLFRNSCDAFSIIDSCNGILLLRIRYLYGDHYIVFNPITCGIANVLLSKKQDTTSSWLVAPCTGLVVEVDITASSPSFKLVEVLSREDDQDIVRFNVVVPCKNGTYLETPWDFPGLGFSEFALSSNHKPVYLDGCLYWMEKYGQKVLVFNVEKKKARIINGPAANDNIFEIRFFAWFGVARGSLSFVRALATEVVIDAYDPVSDKWEIEHKYLHASCALRDIPYHGLPVLYDGQRIYFQSVIEYDNIYMFDGSNNKWMVIGMVPAGCSDPARPYIPFSPTFAKVSNVYLHHHVHSEMDIHLTSIKENLLELRKLF